MTTPVTPYRWKDEAGRTLRLAWPLVVAQLAQIALITTDVLMMGWLGPRFLAAGNLATSFFNPLLLFGVGTLTAVVPLVAQAIGARDFRSVRRSVRQGFWVALTIAAVLIPIIWQVRPILVALGQAPDIAALAESYIHAAVWLFIPALLFMSLRSFLSAHSDTTVILVITVLGIFVNALADYALIFGKFGFPRLELVGAGIATTLVNAVMFVLMLAYVLTHRRYKRYAILKRLWRPDWPRYAEIFKVGAPIGLMILSEVGLFSVSSVMMGWLGTTALAAHAIALQCASITFMVPLGLSQAATVRVGLAYGERSGEAVRKASWMALAMSSLFMAMASVTFLVFPEGLAGLFLHGGESADRATLALAVSYLGVAALFQLVDGAQSVAAGALRGLSDTRVPMFVAIIGYWLVGLPVAYLCGFVLDMSGVGIWLGLAGGLAFVAVVLTIRLALLGRRLPVAATA